MEKKLWCGRIIKPVSVCLAALLLLTAAGPVPGETDTADPPPVEPVFLTNILNSLEKKYLSGGFCADFEQTSTLQAMDITDTATGKIYVKPPGMMRWEYETPDPQLIVSDGENLWVYRPEDNQVMIGESPTFFGDGKGAGFLSDIRQIRENFELSLKEPEDPGAYLLKAVPRENMLDVSVIYLFISKMDFHVTRVITRNTYGDETCVDLLNIRFDVELPNDMFTFEVSESMDVLRLDE
ncbi:MAG: outer membrane lipoprotein carrier protein LolA [Desulfobacterales bacterium]